MDRRTIWAILLMMAIAIAPAIFMKKSPASGKRGSGAAGQIASPSVRRPLLSACRRQQQGGFRRSCRRGPAAVASRRQHDCPAAPPRPAERPTPSASPRRSTPTASARRGGRLVEATLSRYRSMAPGQTGAHRPSFFRPDSRLLGLTLVLGQDTIPLHDWPFTVSAESLDVKGPTHAQAQRRSGTASTSI